MVPLIIVANAPIKKGDHERGKFITYMDADTFCFKISNIGSKFYFTVVGALKQCGA